MTVSPDKLQRLKESQISIHSSASASEKDFNATYKTIETSLKKIQWILANPSQYQSHELIEALDNISHVFRTANFSTIILPVLEKLAQDEDHKSSWKDAKIWDTNMPLTPKSFENIKKSIAGGQNEWGETMPAKIDRELALLSVYNVTMIRIGEALRNTK